MTKKSILEKAKNRIDTEAASRGWYGHIGYTKVDGELGLAITITAAGGKSALTRMIRKLGLDSVPRSVRVVPKITTRSGEKRAASTKELDILRKQAAARLKD